jgi:cyanophycin synthetase
MEFRKILALRGPNIWAHFPVLEAWIDLGALNDFASDELPGFNERLMAWLPSLVEHRCNIGTRGGFFERLRRGTYQAHILEHVALELQSLAGAEVGFGRTRATAEDRVYKIALEYEEEELGRAALEVGRRLCLAAIRGLAFDVPGEIDRLAELYRCLRPGAITAAVLEAARQQGVPTFRLEGGLVQLGHGCRQRRMLGAQTDRTGALGEYVARDPDLARSLLQAAGVQLAEEARSEKPARRLVVIAGRVVAVLRPGASEDAAASIHPALAERTADAARVVGLNAACVSISAGDLHRPLEEQAGGVAAVVPLAEMDLQGLAPEVIRSIGKALLGELIPHGQTGRIPLVAVTGVNGKTTTTRLIASILTLARACVGMTCTEGIYIAGRRIESGDCSGPLSARAVLCNPAVEAAVLETARGGILRAGLGFDRCDVGVVTNIGEGDHLGVSDIGTVEQLAKVKRNVVEVVAPTGAAVLKADDPLVAAMASACRGRVVFFAREEHPRIVRHRAEGGRAAFVRDGRVVLAEGEQEIPLIALERVPLTHGGRVGFQVENVLAASAAAWSLGIPCETIRAALGTFRSDLSQAPGRFNVLELNGATVVLDYGHNSSSLASLLETLEQMPHSFRSAVYTAAGDRRDEDLIRQGELLGDFFDRVILYEEEKCARGRQEGEIIALFRRGLTGRRRVRKIEEVRGALESVRAALESAQPGEVLLVQVDQVDETVALVRRYLEESAGGRRPPAREIDLREALAAFTGASSARGESVDGPVGAGVSWLDWPEEGWGEAT